MSSTADLEDLICRYLVEDEGGRAIGFAPELRVQVFVDLLSAALVPEQAEILTAALLPELGSVDPAKDGIVTPKWGNPILGSKVAEALGLPLLLGRDDCLFEKWLDGGLEADRTWTLVDDVASDGERLVELVERASNEGIKIARAQFVVIREEGDAVELLERERVPVAGLQTWDDDGLRELKARWQKRSAA